ncbi:hypothetical protein, partial [Dactylosporangium matsuzakiense]|uniref:hypothetical protein n=1 Tax=Dactylosporangium matsuzakiense TaxID=53360 RepID=UPI0022F3022C
MKPTVHVQVQQQDLVDVDEVVVGAALPGRQIRVHLGPAQADHVVAVLAQERVVQPAVARGHDAGMAPGDGGRALHVHHAAADDQPLRRAHPGQAFVEGGHAHAAAVDALQQHDRQVHQQRPAGAGTGTVAQRRLECDSRAAVSSLMPRPAWISSRSASNTSVMPRTYRRRLPRESRPLVATAAPVGPPFPRPRVRAGPAVPRRSTHCSSTIARSTSSGPPAQARAPSRSAAS